MEMKQKQRHLGQTQEDLKRLQTEASSFESDFKKLSQENENLQKKLEGFKDSEGQLRSLNDDKARADQAISQRQGDFNSLGQLRYWVEFEYRINKPDFPHN